MRISPVILVLVLVIFACPAGAGLRSWYEFEGDFSNSVTGPAATAMGNAQIVTDGERGQVLSLDGNEDYLNCGYDSIANIEIAMTLAAWIKTSNLANNDGIIANG